MSAAASTSAAPAINGSRTLRLHVWGSSSTVPTLDPPSLYAASLLRATFADKQHVKLQLASASTSLPRVPLLQVLDEDHETLELLDNVEAIRAYCVAAGLDTSFNSNPELGAKRTALHALLDDQLMDLTLHSLFSLPANFRTVTAPAYSSVGGIEASSSSNPLAKLASLPARFQPSIPSRLRNVVETRLTAIGLWGMGGKEAIAKSGEADELASRAGIVPARKKGLGQGAKDAVRDEFERSKLGTRWRDVLDVVDAALVGEAGAYMLGVGELSSLDAHVFGYLAPLLFVSPKLPVDTLSRLLSGSYPRLAAYLSSVKERLFPDTTHATTWISPTDALLTASPTPSSGLLSYIWPFAPSSTPSNKASFASPPPSSTPSYTTTPSPPHGRSRQKPSSSASSSEDRRLRWGRALWICSALVGLVGYTFASGIPTTGFATHDPSTTCAAPSSVFDRSRSEDASSVCPRIHHLVTGTFNSPHLHVLAYDALASTLSIIHTIPAHGPHQYLALGLSSTHRQTVYATTWAEVSTLSSWRVTEDYSLEFGNERQITATGSYVHVQPPPFSTLTGPGFGGQPGAGRWLGSAGGPTGELHPLDPETGSIGERVKELIFLPGGEEELKTADKTRKALRYGAHSFDVTASGDGGQVAYVADLGANAIQAYTFPSLNHLYTIPSKRAEDGPRHVIPHPHHPVVFTVTEHSNYVDAYQVPPHISGAKDGVRHVAQADLLTPTQAAHRAAWRGDTLRFSSDLRFLYATTRGKTAATKGLLVAYRLSITTGAETGDVHVEMREVARLETRTSGGKANAIEISPYSEGGRDTMILTDDEEGWLDVVSFDGGELRVEATTKLPGLERGEAQGASHAIWLL